MYLKNPTFLKIPYQVEQPYLVAKLGMQKRQRDNVIENQGQEQI